MLASVPSQPVVSAVFAATSQHVSVTPQAFIVGLRDISGAKSRSALDLVCVLFACAQMCAAHLLLAVPGA